jgi:serine/threonine protein kinase
VSELCEIGDLFDFFEQLDGAFPDNLVRQIMTQLLDGVKYLHHRNIAHRDLKVENLLLDKNMRLMVADFGFCKNFGDHVL